MQQRVTREITISLILVFATASVASAGDGGSQDIVVTAQKRDQALLDVPEVVNVVGKAALESAGVHDIKTLQMVIPGLILASDSNETNTTARIRGAGTVGDNPGLESSVGVVIDGVARPRIGVGLEDLGELTQAEVLKGPQGALFGLNATSGVINITTEAPKFTPGSAYELTLGNYDARGGSVMLTGPLDADKTLAGRLFFAARERDGFVKVNGGDGPRTQDDDNQNYGILRGQLLWRPREGVRTRIIADYSLIRESCCVSVQIGVSPASAALLNSLSVSGAAEATTANPAARTGYSNNSTLQRIHDAGLSSQTDVDLPQWGAKLTSISSWRDWRVERGQDIDFTGLDVFYRLPNGDSGDTFHNASQELRLSGETARLSWLIGGYAAAENLQHRDSYIYGTAYEPLFSELLSGGSSTSLLPLFTGLPLGQSYAPGQATRDTYNQRSRSAALFTDETFKATDRLSFNFGLRYSEVVKHDFSDQTSPDGALACADATALAAKGAGIYGGLNAATTGEILGALCVPWANSAFNNRSVLQAQRNDAWTGTARAIYQAAPGLNAYVSYASGFKAGGFNLDRAQTNDVPNPSTAFAPETTESVELGLKFRSPDGGLTAGAALFDQSYRHFQLNEYLNGAFVVESIPALRTRGLDLDATWRTPVAGLSLTGGATFDDARYSRFTANQLTNPGDFAGLSLLPGATPAFAPKTSLVSSAHWTGLWGAFPISTDLSAKYMSRYETGSDLLPAKSQAGYALWNGALAINAPDRRWTFELWGRNLTGQRYYQVAFSEPFQGAAFQSTVQPNGTYYNPAKDTQGYAAFLGDPRTYGVTVRARY